MTTDTPITDAIAHYGYSEAGIRLRLLDLCRELERKNARLMEYARAEADWRLEGETETRDSLRIKAAKMREVILSNVPHHPRQPEASVDNTQKL